MKQDIAPMQGRQSVCLENPMTRRMTRRPRGAVAA